MDGNSFQGWSHALLRWKRYATACALIHWSVLRDAAAVLAGSLTRRVQRRFQKEMGSNLWPLVKDATGGRRLTCSCNHDCIREEREKAEAQTTVAVYGSALKRSCIKKGSRGKSSISKKGESCVLQLASLCVCVRACVRLWRKGNWRTRVVTQCDNCYIYSKAVYS